MHDEMKKMDLSEICQIEKDLISALRTVVSHGVFSKDVDTKELGELVDMVKDMAETKRNCWEACYYETVTEAMKEYDEEDAMGYNPNRYRSGKYAPSGTGDRTYGYVPSLYPRIPIRNGMDDVMGPWDRLYDGPMGYSKGRPAMGPYDGDRMSDHYRDGKHDKDRGSQYGSAFEEYEDARRHYTETKSLEDKSHMDEKAMEHLNHSMMTLREIWKNADPEVKREVSASISSLASEFKSV